MRIIGLLAAGSALALGATIASAGIHVYGTTSARVCYEVTEFMRPATGGLAACTRSIEEEPLSHYNEVATFVNRGIIRRRAGDRDGAIADFDHALRLDPTEPEAYLQKGISVLGDEGDWREARLLFDEALRHDIRRPEVAHFWRAISSEIGGDIRSAYRDYKRATELAPHWREPTAELARFRVISKTGA